MLKLKTKFYNPDIDRTRGQMFFPLPLHSRSARCLESAALIHNQTAIGRSIVAFQRRPRCAQRAAIRTDEVLRCEGPPLSGPATRIASSTMPWHFAVCAEEQDPGAQAGKKKSVFDSPAFRFYWCAPRSTFHISLLAPASRSNAFC